MLFKQMQYFVTVINCNSFTEAAEECFISQSAISQQIMALEAELGVKLLTRERRKFTITEAGEYFYHQALILLDEADRLKRETVRIASGSQPEIRIGYLRTCSLTELTPVISSFAEQNPDIKIHIQPGNHEELYQQLRDKKLDIVVNDQRRAFSDEYVNFELVKMKSFVEINNKNHLSFLPKLTPVDLKRIPCILIAAAEQEKNEQDYYQNTFIGGESFIFAENIEEARLLVAGNRGYLLLESLHPTSSADSQFIKSIPLYRNGEQIERQYCAFWKKANNSELLENFAERLFEEFNKNK